MDRLGVMMAMLVMWLVITTNLSGVVTQSVRLGGCGVEDGIFSCSKTGTADIITSIQQTDVNTIDVIASTCFIATCPGFQRKFLLDSPISKR